MTFQHDTQLALAICAPVSALGTIAAAPVLRNGKPTTALAGGIDG